MLVAVVLACFKGKVVLMRNMSFVYKHFRSDLARKVLLAFITLYFFMVLNTCYIIVLLCALISYGCQKQPKVSISYCKRLLRLLQSIRN